MHTDYAKVSSYYYRQTENIPQVFIQDTFIFHTFHLFCGPPGFSNHMSKTFTS